MPALYLTVIILGVSGQNVTKKMYAEKVGGGGVFLFSALTALFSMLFFVITASGLHWDLAVAPYALAFAASYALSNICGVLAIAEGPLSLSSLMISYSLMIPTLYGIVFLNEPVSVAFLVGAGLLAVSLFLVNRKTETCRIRLRWLILVFLSFVGNGLCSTFQKMQQLAFDGAYKNEFMILSLATVSTVLAAAALIGARGNFKTELYHARFLAPASGVMNGAVNLLVMILSGMMSVSVMFPLISAGGIVVTYLVSKFLYKEKLTKMQMVGFVIGLASIVFLSL